MLNAVLRPSCAVVMYSERQHFGEAASMSCLDLDGLEAAACECYRAVHAEYHRLIH